MSGPDLADLLQRAAQDLREYADSAEESGSPIGATEALLDEIDRALAVEEVPR